MTEIETIVVTSDHDIAAARTSLDLAAESSINSGEKWFPYKNDMEIMSL